MLAATAFLVNVNETTRVYTNPLLRESFSLPFLWMQIACVVLTVRNPVRTALSTAAARRHGNGAGRVGPGTKKRATSVARQRMLERAKAGPGRVARLRAVVEPCVTAYPEVVATTFLFMISWQFSQFVMFLQAAALLATHLLGSVLRVTVSSGLRPRSVIPCCCSLAGSCLGWCCMTCWFVPCPAPCWSPLLCLATSWC